MRYFFTIIFLILFAFPVSANLLLDSDLDGVPDKDETGVYYTDPYNRDTDGDGYSDWTELNFGFSPHNSLLITLEENGLDPLSTEKIVLKKRIEIDTGRQNLKYFLGDVAIKEFVVSTGKPGMETPKGHFKVDYKDKKAWSAKYGLWMPYWMSLQNGYFGIHELPEWPGGYKEGVDHLGKPVSHGCIRLRVGDAEFLYNWAPMGTEVFIY